MTRQLRTVLRELEDVFRITGARLELERDGARVRAMLMPTTDHPAIVAWGSDSPAALAELLNELERRASALIEDVGGERR